MPGCSVVRIWAVCSQPPRGAVKPRSPCRAGARRPVVERDVGRGSRPAQGCSQLRTDREDAAVSQRHQQPEGQPFIPKGSAWQVAGPATTGSFMGPHSESAVDREEMKAD